MMNTAGASINYSQAEAQGTINDHKNGETNGCGSKYYLRLLAMTTLTTSQITQRKLAAVNIFRSTLRAAFMSVVVVVTRQSPRSMAPSMMDRFLMAAR